MSAANQCVYSDRDKVKIVEFTLTYNFYFIHILFGSSDLAASIGGGKPNFRVTIESRKQGHGELEKSNSRSRPHANASTNRGNQKGMSEAVNPCNIISFGPDIRPRNVRCERKNITSFS